MPIIVNYEIYVMTSAGTWSLYDQLPKSGERRAFALAKKLETEQKYPVKILISALNTGTNKVQESVVYMTEGAKEISTNLAHKKLKLSKNGIPIPPLKIAKTKEKEKKGTVGSVMHALSKIGIVILLSIVIAFLLSSLTLVVMSRFSYGIDSYTASKISLSVFLVSFTISLIPLLTYTVPWQNFNSLYQENNNKKDNYFVEDEEFYIPQESFSNIKGFFDKIFDNNNYDYFEKPDEFKPFAKPLPDIKKEVKPEIKKEALNPLINQKQGDLQQNIKDKKADNLQTFNPDAFKENNKSTDISSENAFDPSQFKDKEQKFNENTVLTPQPPKEIIIGMEQVKEISDFANSIIEKIRDKHNKLNNHGKMGLHLLIAGACEKLCEKLGVDFNKTKQLVIRSIEVLGANHSLAVTFSENLELYHYNKDYRFMIDIGADAYNRKYQGRSDAFLKISNAFDDWVEVEKQEKEVIRKSETTVTIMFTDIVGSTKATQALGDAAAQNMIREHNQIVRRALQNNFGKEVKHTGDGIMASFMSAFKAVAAAIDIQKDILEYNLNSKTGTFPIMLRVGLNAGEPIVEEDDFFGSTVQLAARICNEAKPNQILVSSVVKELSEGKKFYFNDLGLVSLKGIEEKKRIYEVDWNKS